MSFQHHEAFPPNRDLRDRFIDETLGRAQREFPDGRIGPEDDGVLTYAIAADVQHGVVKIVFSNPTQWIGLDMEGLTALRLKLAECMMELQTSGAK